MKKRGKKVGGKLEWDEKNEETITEWGREGYREMWLSKDAVLAESCQCVTVVVKVKVPLGRDSDNGLHQPATASHRPPDAHTLANTHVFREMLFVLSSSACLSASKPEWRWQARD